MLRITDPTLKRMILLHLVEQVTSNQDVLDQMLLANVDPRLIDVLRQRPGLDFISTAKMDRLVIEAIFDPNVLLECFGRVDDIKKDAAMREYFVKNGAPVDLLQRFFKLREDEIRELRSLLLDPKLRVQGRTKMPPVAERQGIHEAWALLSRQHDSPRERLYRLHQQFAHHSIASLWSSVHEFDAPTPVTGASRRSHI